MSGKLSLTLVVVVTALSFGLVGLAAATDSWVPLFLVWIPQLPIPWIAARSSRGRPAN